MESTLAFLDCAFSFKRSAWTALENLRASRAFRLYPARTTGQSINPSTTPFQHSGWVCPRRTTGPGHVSLTKIHSPCLAAADSIPPPVTCMHACMAQLPGKWAACSCAPLLAFLQLRLLVHELGLHALHVVVALHHLGIVVWRSQPGGALLVKLADRLLCRMQGLQVLAVSRQ